VQKHPGTLLVHAAMASVSVLFAINYIISKLGMHVFDPLTFAYLRVLGAAIILNTVLRERNAAPVESGDGWRLFGFSILGVVINQSLFLAGLALTIAAARAKIGIVVMRIAAACAVVSASPARKSD
jgi:drug/metabolite transporter (DMT)-like permease